MVSERWELLSLRATCSVSRMHQNSSDPVGNSGKLHNPCCLVTYSIKSFSTLALRSSRALVSRKFPFLSTSHIVGMLAMPY